MLAQETGLVQKQGPTSKSQKEHCAICIATYVIGITNCVVTRHSQWH